MKGEEEARLEGDLARRYRQPRGVEQFGIEAVPEDRRTVRWYDLFSIILNFLVNPGMILGGALAVASGLSFWAAVLSLVLGIALASGAYVIMATVGVDHGLPGQVATRLAFGIRGAKIGPSSLRAIASIYWFGFQTIAGALGVVAVLHAMTGRNYNLALVSVVLAVAQVLVATMGYDPLRHLARVAFFSKLIITGLLLWVLISRQGHSPAQVFAFGGKAGWSWALMAVWVNTSASAWLSMITDAADFCRYSRSRMDMWIGTLLAAVLGEAIAVFLGGYAVAAVAAKTTNPFSVMASGSGIWVLVALLIYIVFDNWTINVLNLYTGGLAICNIFTRLGRFWATLITSAAGVVLSLFSDLARSYSAEMNIMGSVFAPVAGVLIVDYLVIRRMRIDVPALFEREGRYWYWRGFNWIALGWTVIGFAIAFLIPAAWVKTASTGIFTAAGYLVSVLVLKARSKTLDRASAAVEVRVDLAEFDRKLADG